VICQIQLFRWSKRGIRNYPVIAETPLMDEFLEKDAKDAKQ
jgi:hypothetical protein